MYRLDTESENRDKDGDRIDIDVCCEVIQHYSIFTYILQLNNLFSCICSICWTLKLNVFIVFEPLASTFNDIMHFGNDIFVFPLESLNVSGQHSCDMMSLK